MDEQKHIGGEFGEIRASIDTARLNAYLAQTVPRVRAPVAVKQFKVRAGVAQ
jgi:hypothetical protein